MPSRTAPCAPALSPKTVRNYADSAVQLLEHARSCGGAGDLTTMERADVQAYLGDLAASWSRAHR